MKTSKNFFYIFLVNGQVKCCNIRDDFFKILEKKWLNIHRGNFCIEEILETSNIFISNDRNIDFYFFSNIDNITETGKKLFSIIKKVGDKDINCYILNHSIDHNVKKIDKEYSEIFKSNFFFSNYLSIFKSKNKTNLNIKFNNIFYFNLFNLVKVNDFKILDKTNNNLIKNKISKNTSFCIKKTTNLVFNFISIM